MPKVRIKSIPDYEDYYILSNGQVWSTRSKKFLKPNHDTRGYESIELWKDGKRKRVLIHRLVAKAFIPNPNNYPQINHIDENQKNNDVSNLEWCTAKYNANYGTAIERRSKHPNYINRKFNLTKQWKICSKPVSQYTKAGEFIKTWPSASECSRHTGIHTSCICRAVSGERKTAGGYVFKEVSA